MPDLISGSLELFRIDFHLHAGGITRAGHGVLVDQVIEFRDGGGIQHHVDGAEIFLYVGGMAGAGNGHDVRRLGECPGDGELPIIPISAIVFN